MYPGSRRAYGAPESYTVEVTTSIDGRTFAIELPPNSMAKLNITMRLNVEKAQFLGFSDL